MTLPGTRYLIDTSAMARIADLRVRAIILAAIDNGTAATCVTVDLEAIYSGRNVQEIEQLLKVRTEHFQQLPVTVEVQERAKQVMLLLAHRGMHRVAGVFDALTAAVAEIHRATILHYDADFEHIASVTGQQHRWIVPRGEIP